MSKNSKTLRTTLAALAGLASLGAAAVAVTPSDTDPSVASVTDDRARPRRGRAYGSGTTVDNPCAFAVGSTMAYDVKTATRNVIDMGGLMDQVQLDESAPMQAEATAIDQAASRQWHVDLTAVAQGEDGSTVLAAHIAAESTEIDGVGPHAPAESLGDGFLLRLDPHCSIREFGWRTEGDLDTAREQQALMAGLAYLAPKRAEDGYGGLLFDALGRYFAQYDVQGDGTLVGRAVEYRKPFGQAMRGMAPTFDVVKSTVTVVPADGQWFASLNHEREVALSMMDQTLGTLRSSVNAVAGEPRSDVPALNPHAEGWTWGLLLGRPGPVKSRVEAKRAELVGVSIGEAVTRYQAIVEQHGYAIDAVPELVAWLQANPEGAADVLAQLRAGAFDGRNGGAPGVFLALGTAGTDEATSALLDILETAGDLPGHKISAAQALVNVQSPTSAMIDAVVAGVDNADDSVTRGSLAMSLGSFAHHNADRAPELAERARGQISDWLADPADDADLAGSLLAAGNAGHDGLAAAIEPYFEHDDPEIRQRAAHAMRHMSPEEAFPRLSDTMVDDDPAVRASAAETALSVSRSRGAQLPEQLVDTAIEQLDLSEPSRGQKALLGLLGEAAKSGNAGADAVLAQHMADELETGITDLDKLQTLGQHMGTRWTAD